VKFAALPQVKLAWPVKLLAKLAVADCESEIANYIHSEICGSAASEIMPAGIVKLLTSFAVED